MTDAQRGPGNVPTPVRASLGAGGPEADAPPAEVPSSVKRFRHGEEEWLARVAGESAYGTGQRGAAYLVAVHFVRASDDATPVKEALVPAAQFDGLAEAELRVLFERAVTIDLDREPSAASRSSRRSLRRRSAGRGPGRRS